MSWKNEKTEQNYCSYFQPAKTGSIVKNECTRPVIICVLITNYTELIKSKQDKIPRQINCYQNVYILMPIFNDLGLYYRQIFPEAGRNTM